MSPTRSPKKWGSSEYNVMEQENKNVVTHDPVMLKEAIEYLRPVPGSFIVDGTVDGGGHAEAILDALEARGTFLGIDWDSEMLVAAKKTIVRFSGADLEVVLVPENYANLPAILLERGLPKPDGILLDLGFSTIQLELAGRGFSFLKDEPLLMTYSDSLTPVRHMLRDVREEELVTIIRTYGEERFARRIAAAIKARTKTKMIETSGELAGIIARAVPANYERGRIHPATRTFQALRIYANHELTNLETFLAALPQLLTHAGRVVILSFHSLEDRLVKNYFRDFERKKQLRVLTKKPVCASEEEIMRNPKSRSVKLRAACAV